MKRKHKIIIIIILVLVSAKIITYFFNVGINSKIVDLYNLYSERRWTEAYEQGKNISENHRNVPDSVKLILNEISDAKDRTNYNPNQMLNKYPNSQHCDYYIEEIFTDELKKASSKIALFDFINNYKWDKNKKTHHLNKVGNIFEYLDNINDQTIFNRIKKTVNKKKEIFFNDLLTLSEINYNRDLMKFIYQSLINKKHSETLDSLLNFIDGKMFYFYSEFESHPARTFSINKSDIAKFFKDARFYIYSESGSDVVSKVKYIDKYGNDTMVKGKRSYRTIYIYDIKKYKLLNTRKFYGSMPIFTHQTETTTIYGDDPSDKGIKEWIYRTVNDYINK